ncbi:abortive infection protein [Frateuria sp. Soil773]|uniref:CPBP family glutamic-type intramembrane protease n=1 Tax=Frateuria sp. Soil773 TaxID=1736407 RepID=UPI0006FDF762|nr:CPBP family glutamic-type intramembrane protease [Frateuria sp. Soil773]KRE88346.1 abortive infection protein [Frateuria sp. Soil773]
MSAYPSQPYFLLPSSGPHLKLAAWLGVAGALAMLALVPYLMQLMPQKFAAHSLPLPIGILATVAQTGVLCWLLGWIGLSLGAPYGLDAPWLRAWAYRRPRDPARPSRWWLAAVLGVLVGLLVVGLSLLGPNPDAGNAPIAAWRGALASPYGGIVEEIMCRLLPISALVWLLARCNRRVARPWMFVLAIVLAALLFGASHLPAAQAAGLLGSPLLVARIVLLNAAVGVVSGGLFWKYGLEHAMLAHFCADLMLHVAAPLVGS